MSIDDLTLGARWVAKDGGWQPGMLGIRPSCPVMWYRVLRCYDDTGIPSVWTEEDGGIIDGENGGGDFPRDAVPALSDSATRGAALDVVRVRRGDPQIHVWPTTNEEDDTDVTWWVRAPMRYGSSALGSGSTEAEAIVAALEARTVLNTTSRRHRDRPV